MVPCSCRAARDAGNNLAGVAVTGCTVLVVQFRVSIALLVVVWPVLQ